MHEPTVLPFLFALAAVSIGSACAQDLQADTRSGQAVARIDVTVRMMRADEVRSRLGDALLPAEAVGLFLLPQATVSRGATDGVTTAVLGPPGGVDFEVPARAVQSELAATTLSSELEALIRGRLRAAPLEAGDAYAFDVVIAYHGLRSEEWRPSVQSESATYCLVTGGRVGIVGRYGPIESSAFQRGVDARSDGMPEPECRTLTDYAADGAVLLRRATRDTADVLAAWIVNRTLQNR